MITKFFVSLTGDKQYISQYSANFYRFLTQSPSRTIKATALLTAFLFVPQIILTWRAHNKFKNIIVYELQLHNLSNQIVYLDEVLTMSARMNAATGNQMWEKRYRKFEPKLDTAIKKSIKLAPKVYSTENAKQTDVANQKLVKMEYQSFDLVNNGKKQAAQALLFSNEYQAEKEKYNDGVTKINLAISKQVREKVITYRKELFFTSFFSGFSLVMLIPAWLIVLRLLNEYLKQRQMAEAALQKTNQELELRVEERTQELSDKNIHIQETLKELQDTQIQLIHTEKMSGLGQLVGGVAHEINNPVTFIDGNIRFAEQYAQNLLQLLELYQKYFPSPPIEIKNLIQAVELDFLKEDILKIYQSIKVGTQRIQDIVVSLRNFSRLDEADFKQVDIHEGINSTLMILQHRLQSKANYPEITIIKKYNQLPRVKCYPGQLNQAFMSIISNAIDALETEINHQNNHFFIPQISISTELSNHQHIIIRITDNGCGIAEEISSKLFDLFFTTKPVGKGTGLGLSIAYKIIVGKHNGKLSFNSILAQGTEFVIEIPITQ
ncbi:MAG: ATP-binding protein [Nostocales cyanobacterium 94392]|nr:ATP-binding protein [Nostocales cyanobacterium 94392]